jgi:signal peptidase I
LTATIKRLWKNEYFQTATVIALIAVTVMGLWYGSQIVLNTKIPPALAVVSGSMCVPYDGACTGWLSADHPFERTLHTGDLIIIQGLDPKDLKTNYPDSDIIVYQNPSNPTNPDDKIVHRIVATTEINGTLYFYTKGDGNGYNKWPDTPNTAEYDPWSPVPANLIYGKVIMRIPWIGYIPYFVQGFSSSSGVNISYIVIPIIVLLIILLVLLEFILPLLKRKQTAREHNSTPNNPNGIDKEKSESS